MKKIFSIFLALVLVTGLGAVMGTPVIAQNDIINVPGDYSTIQEAIDAASDGDTIMVAEGTYAAFQVIDKNNIHIIGAEGATVTTGDVFSIDVGPIGDAWVMAAVKDSQNINIQGIDFDGTALSKEEVVVGIAYVDSTGRIADLTVENIIGTELGAGVAILGYAGTSVVDLSAVTVENSMAGVSIWDAEANLDGCTIAGNLLAGILVGTPEEWWGPSTVEMKGSTISNNSDIGIYVCDDSILEAHFNNIVGNTWLGVLNDGAESVDAAYNWWGHASGPYHSVGNPGGTGNAVSDNVDFNPWLSALSAASKTERVIGDGIVDARTEADTVVAVQGTATVTVARYASNPQDGPPTEAKSLEKYIDVYVPDIDQVTEIEIRIYYYDHEVFEDQELLQIFWWDGNKWEACSYIGVDTASTNGYSGYAWARINANTQPSLTDLIGTEMDLREGPRTPPCAIATAAYGTDTAKEIAILREFRDTVLLPTDLGAAFVALYHRTSPPMADLISRHEVLRTAVRVGLVDPIVAVLEWSQNLWLARGSPG